MRPRRSWRFLISAVLLLAVVGCSGRRPPRERAEPGKGNAGVYRVRIEQDGEKDRRFKLLLFAEVPDRLHGEIVSPVGPTVLIFDGGQSKLAVTFVRDGVAFVGAADRDAVGRVFGVAVSLQDLVGGLLTGKTSDDGIDVIREGPETGMPDRFELATGARRLTLELRKRLVMTGSTATIGIGEPPQGMELRSLDELRMYEPSDSELGE